MSELSVHFCEDSITFVRDGELAGVMPIEAIHQEGLELFRKQNYELQGSVGYSAYLAGVLSGLTLAYGPPSFQRVSVAASTDGQSDSEPQSIDASEVGTVEDVLLEPVADTRGLTPLGSPEEVPAETTEAPAQP